MLQGSATTALMTREVERLVRQSRAGAGGAGLTTATLSDRQGPFAKVMQAVTFERREAQAQPC